MQFSTLFSIALLALAEKVVADSQSFGMQSIRSGSSLQYAAVYPKDGVLYLGSSDGKFSAIVTDAGALKLSDNTFAVVQADGSIKEGTEADATKGFAISNGYLTYGTSGFYGVLSNNVYLLSLKNTGDATSVALRTINTTGSSVADFTPAGNGTGSGNSTSTETVTSHATTTSTKCDTACHPTTTLATTTKSTVDAISQITDGQIQATATVSHQTQNGAAKYGAGLGAGVLAVAALLL